jgi:hypothetical protein
MDEHVAHVRRINATYKRSPIGDQLSHRQAMMTAQPTVT